MSSNRYLKRSDIRKIMNYIRNSKKEVTITDEYNNDMGMDEFREYTGVVKSYTLSKVDPLYCEYVLTIIFEDGHEMKVWFDTDDLLLSKFGDKCFKLGYCNAGPWCYFTIKFK